MGDAGKARVNGEDFHYGVAPTGRENNVERFAIAKVRDFLAVRERLTFRFPGCSSTCPSA